MLRDAAKRAVAGTRLEPWARRLWRSIGRRQSVDDRAALYDRQTIEIMRRVLSRDSNCVDVGAFKGEILAEMLAIAPEGHHMAFEPLPHRAAELRQRFPSVDIFEAALADETGRLPFRHVLHEEAYSGFFRRPYDSYDEHVEMIEVDVIRLDDVVPLLFRPRFMKVDVEGSEAKVFSGGLDTIRRSRTFIVYESGWDPPASFEVLSEGAGLRLSLLGDWLAGKGPLSRQQFLDEALGGRHYYFLAYPEA